MSGTADTSTPAQQQAFCNAVEGSAAGPFLPAAAALVAACQAHMPPATAYLLGLPDTATYAHDAALLQTRWTSGRAGY